MLSLIQTTFLPLIKPCKYLYAVTSIEALGSSLMNKEHAKEGRNSAT